MTRGTFMQVHFVCQLWPLLEQKGLLTVIYVFDIIWLDYCNIIYVGLALERVRIYIWSRMQSLERYVLVFLYNTLFQKLYWFPICSLIQCKLLFVTFKVLYGSGSEYLEDLFPTVSINPLRFGWVCSLCDSSLRKYYLQVS